VKKRWKLLIGLGVAALATAVVPMVYIEGTCRDPIGDRSAAAYTPILTDGDRRPEARTWLTYPEWHIVYSAESLGRHLRTAPPSSYSYWRDIRGFWTSYCMLNRRTRGMEGAGDAKVMIYTIGASFTAELGIKMLYENSIGLLSEKIGGWHSQDDHYAGRVQRTYGGFMHDLPWYRFPFWSALRGEWRTSGEGAQLRHWERRLALSGEYGVKAGYAWLIDRASGATLGRDEPRLRFAVRATPAQIAGIDQRFKVVRSADGTTIVDAPRYAEFSDLLLKMAARQIRLVEIAGNDDIFATFIVSERAAARLPQDAILLSLPLGDRPGWRRVGVSTKVVKLLPLIQSVRARGGSLEHVYDY
jgi:hypothetical protein